MRAAHPSRRPLRGLRMRARLLKQALRRHAAGFREMIKTPAIVAKPHGVGPQFDDKIVQLRRIC
jgi:hypothetical protein